MINVEGDGWVTVHASADASERKVEAEKRLLYEENVEWQLIRAAELGWLGGPDPDWNRMRVASGLPALSLAGQMRELSGPHWAAELEALLRRLKII